MVLIDRRSLLLALGAVSVVGCMATTASVDPKHPLRSDLDLDAVNAISDSYLKAAPNVRTQLEVRNLFDDGEINLAILKLAVENDFIEKRVFQHNGWILSNTEGKLFWLLSVAK